MFVEADRGAARVIRENLERLGLTGAVVEQRDVMAVLREQRARKRRTDLVLCDLARIDPYEVAASWPDIPILGYTNHTDTSGLRAAREAGLDQVVARSALAERAPQLVEELVT